MPCRTQNLDEHVKKAATAFRRHHPLKISSSRWDWIFLSLLARTYLAPDSYAARSSGAYESSQGHYGIIPNFAFLPARARVGQGNVFCSRSRVICERQTIDPRPNVWTPILASSTRITIRTTIHSPPTAREDGCRIH